MYFITVTVDKIIEIHDRSTLYASRTEFSFIGDGRPHYAVTIPGRPRIIPGMKITALLRNESDWQTLRGWKDWGSGEVIPSNGAEELILRIVFTMIAIGWMVTSGIPTGLNWEGLSLFALAFSLGVLNLWVQTYRRFRDLTLLRRLSKPETGFAKM